MSALPPFIKGFELSSLYFKEAVQPILDSYFPHLDYSAGLLDFGSDVLGFDTPMSRDHDWGPRLILFLDENELKSKRVSILLADNKDILESIALCQHLKTEGVEKVSKVLGSLQPHPFVPAPAGRGNYFLGLFEPFCGSKSPRERDFHPLPVLGRGTGG